MNTQSIDLHNCEHQSLSHSIDIDECLEAAISSIDLCEDVENSQCVNVIGSYNCSCVSGYEMISGLCERKPIDCMLSFHV